MDKYSVKAQVLKTDLCKIVKQYDLLNKDTDFIKRIDIEESYTKAFMQYGYDLIREARRINNAFYKRVTRLKERILNYLSMGSCVWLTLTFTDEVLKCTKPNTRRKYVARYLKSQSDFYLANIDFGKQNGREHYHAIVVTDHVDTSFWNDNFGGTKCILVKNQNNCEKKLAKYVSKLTNHAIKETTKRQVYIYSKVNIKKV